MAESKIKYVSEHALKHLKSREIMVLDISTLNILKSTSALLPLFLLVYFPRFILSAEMMSLSSTALLRKSLSLGTPLSGELFYQGLTIQDFAEGVCMSNPAIEKYVIIQFSVDYLITMNLFSQVDYERSILKQERARMR